MKGAIFESKEGRHAILAKVVIDTTGDADLLSRAGVARILISTRPIFIIVSIRLLWPAASLWNAGQSSAGRTNPASQIS